ncbi:MAG: hypothetical protein WCR67_04875 [Bacilli bacterium]
MKNKLILKIVVPLLAVMILFAIGILGFYLSFWMNKDDPSLVSTMMKYCLIFLSGRC